MNDWRGQYSRMGSGVFYNGIELRLAWLNAFSFPSFSISLLYADQPQRMWTEWQTRMSMLICTHMKILPKQRLQYPCRATRHVAFDLEIVRHRSTTFLDVIEKIPYRQRNAKMYETPLILSWRSVMEPKRHTMSCWNRRQTVTLFCPTK